MNPTECRAMTVKLQSVFRVPPRRSASQRYLCKGCGKQLTPTNRSQDASFCKNCLTRLESAFSNAKVLLHVVEKTIIKTVIQKDQGLTESLVLAQERVDGLKISLEQRDAEIRSLSYENKFWKKKYKRLKDYGKP